MQPGVDPQSFTGKVWLMESGSWEVRVEISGSQGTGKLAVPVPAFARRTLPMQKALGALLFALMLFLAIGIISIAGAAAPTSFAPSGWASDLALAVAVDVNPDPHVVEINLDARVADVEVAAGKKVTAWTYDGHLPGPLVRARVGDRVLVHFTNHLPAPTTVPRRLAHRHRRTYSASMTVTLATPPPSHIVCSP